MKSAKKQQKMEDFSTIEEFNDNLVENEIMMSIIDYVKRINEIKFNIDISFIDELLELVLKNECCIHHKMLVKYDILSLKAGSNHIKRLIEQYEFDGQDYRLTNVGESAPNGGCTHKIEYYFHPDAFKLCLMRSLKTKKYAKYYILLEKCIKYFNDYQILLNKKYNIELQDKNMELNKQIKTKDKIIVKKEKENMTLTDRIDELLKRMDEQTKQIKKQNKKMDKQAVKMDKQSEQLSELQITVNKISKKLDDCAHMPTNDELSDRFVVMKSSDDYYVIRAQERNISNAIKRQEDKGYVKINDLIESKTIPNSIYLWNSIKDELIKEKKIETFRNTFTLKISEKDFITIVKSIFDKRKEYN